MKRKESQRKKKRPSNRHLSDQYYYSGEHETKIGIRLIRYNEQSIESREVQTTEDFQQITDTDRINWFQVSGLTDAETITRLMRSFGMNNLDVKDILTPQHVVKIESNEQRTLFILHACGYDEETILQSEHISILVFGNVVISFTESNNPVFERVEKVLETNLLNIRKKGSGLLVAFLLNTLIAGLVETISKTEELLEDIEEALLDISNPSVGIGSKIQLRRRDYMTIRKSSLPLKEQFMKLIHIENNLITTDLLPIYTDLSDQLLFISQTTEGCREIISSLVDLYISNNDLRMNAIMKRLTIVSTIFIPLTFLAGVWGMNFNFMPELNWKYGYALAWLVMMVIGLLTWQYLKKKDWH